MKAQPTWQRPAILAWLQQILLERFGHPVRLHCAEPGIVRLTTEGSATYIDICTDPATFSRADSGLPCTRWNGAAEGWDMALELPLPAPGAARLRTPLIEHAQTGYRIYYDVLGLTYWMLSRQEEVGYADLDDHGRFPASASHAFKHAYLDRPVVDEWLHVLRQVAQRAWPHLSLRRHRFELKVSHDVDRPSRYGFGGAGNILRKVAGDFLKRHDFKSPFVARRVRLNTQTCLHPDDPANTFDWIMDVSERQGLVSAFYFICGRTDPDKDADYEPEHPAIRDLMGRIHKRGHEIGLHPSFGTFNAPDLIAVEATRLKRICAEEGIEQDAWGGRMHYLRWETPTTMYGWENAGMTYDSTLGYADFPGFRCGTCFEYPALDPIAGKQLNLRIRPLIAMECTVMNQRYVGLGTGPESLARFMQLKDACRAVGGTFTLLWHNSEFATPESRRLYKDVLAA